jgi:hypothetical protein
LTGDDGLTLENLVEFSAIEPDAATLGAEIDFHTLSLRHGQRFLTHRAFHDTQPPLVE